MHQMIFFTDHRIMVAMAGGMWVVLIIPAIIAFVFGAWVLYSIMVDVSTRESSPFTVIGPDRVRITVDPGE